MVAGHVCLDIIPRFADTGARAIEEIMRPGKLVNVGEAAVSTGGPVSNTGINMRTLGSSVCFCACVGDDDLGRLTIERLRKSGNADGIHLLQGSASSYTLVISPPGIDRIFLHNPGTNNLFSAADLNAELIAQCRHFHFGYPPLMARMYSDAGAELEKVFKTAKAAGATTSCDMTLPDPASASGQAPWREILGRFLPYVDIYTPSIEETLYMLDPARFLALKEQHRNRELIDFLTAEDYSQIADAVLAMGCKMTTLKSGYRGFYIKTAGKETFAGMGAARPGDADNWSNRQLWAPAYKPDHFGSATGSGDSSIAGLLSAFLRGLPIEAALKYATCCGLQNVRVLDAVSGIKCWDETTAMIASDLPMIDAHVDSREWKWIEEKKIWVGPGDRLN
jgi:sugar/nucleoside kinase (ribokinase family)